MDHFEIVKFEVRLCADLKLITLKHRAELSLKLESIGKQITAWRNSGSKSQNLQG